MATAAVNSTPMKEKKKTPSPNKQKRSNASGTLKVQRLNDEITQISFDFCREIRNMN